MKRCPYPLCIRAEDHDGDHKFGRPKLPIGVLRLVQEFNYAAPSGSSYRGLACDMHADCPVPPAHPRAEGFYADEFGFGWALCVACAKGFSVPAAAYENVVAITAGRSLKKGGSAQSFARAKVSRR
jgi:hypothetical protein